MTNLKYLRPEEYAALKLREIYSNCGYSFYKMSKFEEYDFYAKNKDFLVSKDIITFTDIDGKLMALKPDVTLSIVKHIHETQESIQKFFYDEKIYRTSKSSRTFKEISQAGLECIGLIDDSCISEVLELALKSLQKISEIYDGKKFILDISHLGLLSEILNNEINNEILKFISEKNSHEIKNLNLPDYTKNILVKLIELNPDNALNELKKIFNENKNLTQLEKIINTLEKYHNEISIDFSVINDLNYYNGIVFRGFIEGIPESILSGGQYDNLMLRMGHKNLKAIGFAIYLDLLESAR